MKTRILAPAIAGVLVLGSAGIARADIFVEPIAGYDLGTYSQTGGGEGNAKGWSLGARAGMTFSMLLVGLDFHYGMPRVRETSPGVESQDGTDLNFGLVAGIELPAAPVRFWAGFNFIDRLEAETDAVTFKGTGFKFGGGYKVLPFLSLNVEYQLSSYSKAESALGEIAVDPSVKHNTFIFSVSAPISSPL